MEEKLKAIKDARNLNSGMRNRMGCSEDWYNKYYSVAQTFTDEELESMSEKEIDNLLKLAQNISEALY